MISSFIHYLYLKFNVALSFNSSQTMKSNDIQEPNLYFPMFNFALNFFDPAIYTWVSGFSFVILSASKTKITSFITI